MENRSITEIVQQLDRSSLFRIFAITATSWLLTKAIRRFLPVLAEKTPARMRLALLQSMPVLRLIVLILSIILIIPMIIKPTLPNLIALLGVTSVALGFAFKDYIGSIVAGIVAIYEKPYRPGDWVEIDGAYGEVRSLGLRALRLVTADDTLVVIPHARIWNTNIFNANDGKRDLLCVADFYLNPKHDGSLVCKKLQDIALTSPYLKSERPVIVTASEKPWGTHYRLKAYVIDARDQFHFITDLTLRGKAVLTKLRIEPAMAPPAIISGNK
jgi:small conductance mechanosensitive channel